MKLLNFEWNRLVKLYSLLLGIVFIVQLIGLLFLIMGYITTIQLEVKQNQMSNQIFIDTYGTFGLENIGYSLSFAAPIAISIAALLFYVHLFGIVIGLLEIHLFIDY